MRSDGAGEECMGGGIPDLQGRRSQKAQNDIVKPLYNTNIHKVVPIGYERHQVEVPDISQPLPSPSHLLPIRSPSLFLRAKVQQEELQQYLNFVENFYEEKVLFLHGANKRLFFFSSHDVGSVSRDRTRARAMEFLHQMDYNYVRAKFYLLFPYYLAYNRFRCHQPLQLSDQDMAQRIADHLDGLKTTKEKELERWIGTVQNSIESRIHLSKLNMLIEVAKQNKYEIPEAIRQNVERAIRTGRDLKKTLHSNRMPLDKLQAKRETLQECKIITNEMIQFEETVGRCEEWLKKQRKFEETHFEQTEEGESVLKVDQPKIEFRTVQMLVSEFNNLPLVCDSFDQTTGALYRRTLSLVERLPAINKAAKTRTAQSSGGGGKVRMVEVQQFLKLIEDCPVDHDEFSVFESSFREHVEWLQRIGLWLQDDKSEKSLRILHQYSKIVSDIPIMNRVHSRLQSRLEYYQIMQKVKKDISNPAKYQQIKEAIKKLKQKGYQACQHAKLQSRILSYMKWYENQQKLSQQRLPANTLDLLTQRGPILSRMIPVEEFDQQLKSARTELSIPEEVWAQSQGRMLAITDLSREINSLKTQPYPPLQQTIEVVRAGIKNGLMFDQLDQLYNSMIEVFFLVAQMEFLLIYAGQAPPNNGPQFLFNSQDLEYVFGILNTLRPFDLKELHTKESGDQILEKARQDGFPRELVCYEMFEEFMGRAEAWSQRATNMIKAFREQSGEVSIRELIEESKNCLHSKAIAEELNRIDVVLRWREKINRKVTEGRPPFLQPQDEAILHQLVEELQELERVQETGDSMRVRALEWYCGRAKRLGRLLQIISGVEIETTHKLSEMNKFCKEIDRQIQKYGIEDRVIKELREHLQRQVGLAEEWRERYLAIKRLEKKKVKKIDEQDPKGEEMDQEGVLYQPGLLSQITSSVSGEGRRKFIIKNSEFVWYFKLALMVIEFCNGFSLRFSIEQVVRLRGVLSQVYRFTCNYQTLMSRSDKTDQELQALQVEGSKLPVFTRQGYVLSRKNSYISSWKQLANAVLRSVPILGMQLKARKPQQLLQLLESKRNKQDQIDECRKDDISSKRKRKQNPFYNNQDMTLITEDTFGSKTKKKKKGLNPDTEYRNTAVASQAKKVARSQKEDLERAEALLKGEVPAELIHIDDPKEYCICRYGVPNENSVMVQCEYKCEEWFHIECLGIKKHQTKGELKLRCVGCRALYKEQPTGHFFWDSHAKITEHALTQLHQEGQLLAIETLEMKKMDILWGKMRDWKAAVKDMLRRVCETTPEQLPGLEPSLYELFLQSLWLPSAHPQAAILRKLVLMARGDL